MLCSLDVTVTSVGYDEALSNPEAFRWQLEKARRIHTELNFSLSHDVSEVTKSVQQGVTKA